MAVRPEHGARWRRLAKFHRDTLHGFERRLVKIGAEIRRVKECVGLPQSVVEEAEALVRKHLSAVKRLPAGGGRGGRAVDSREGRRRA
jgi:transcription initiation factor TFIIIB Brf1 subunit/transcription initiation factor TFIIB